MPLIFNKWHLFGNNMPLLRNNMPLLSNNPALFRNNPRLLKLGESTRADSVTAYKFLRQCNLRNDKIRTTCCLVCLIEHAIVNR